MSETITIQAKSWTSRNGQHRRYLNDWLPALFGFKVERYKTGNIGCAELGGERISNRRAGQLLGVKVWLDDDDEIHVDYNEQGRVLTDAQIREAVAAATIETVN